jgi:hypothetical protein
MNWSARRKTIYLLIFFAIAILLIGVPVFLVTYKPPTCFDGKQNEGEAGIDCGGPCEKLCSPLELLPITLWQQTFKVLPGVYTAVAYIQNPNLKAEAFSVPYQFTIYDTSGNVLTQKTGTADIPPGENFAVLESNIQIATATPAHTDFQFSDQFVWQVAPDDPQLTVQNLSISAGQSPSVEADILNPSYTNLPRVDVTAIVYDASGNAFAASKTYLDSLPAQSSGHVVFTWPLPFSGTPTRAEIIPLIDDRPSD